MIRLRLALLTLVPVIAGLFSVWQGRDANWDFLNYRWYNPYALLHARLLQDMLVAGHATFFNPLLELPFYLLATYVPAIVAGFVVAALDGACFVPLFLLAERIVELPDPRHRLAITCAAGLAGITGGGALGQVGIVSWDMPLGILTISAMVVLLSDGQRALCEPPRVMRRRLLWAGFLAGSAAGLKLTAAIYPVGLLAGLTLAGSGGVSRRIARDIWFCLGAAAGVLFFGGFWMAQLYAAFGNPLMPFFNGVFHSAFAPAASNRDTTFLPHGWLQVAAFPFLFTANSRLVAEYDFRDAHIAIAYGLGLLAFACMCARRSPLQPIVNPVAARFLVVVFFASYAAWLFLFGIYRYILPLEMLGPIVALATLSLMPLPRRVQAMCFAASILASACLARAGFDRLPWTPNYVQVAMPMAVPGDAMVLMTGGEPAGFVVPYLPVSVPVIRAGSALADGDRFADVMRLRIAGHTGPLYTILASGDEASNSADLQAYGLARQQTGCQPIVTNTSANLILCPVLRP